MQIVTIKMAKKKKQTKKPATGKIKPQPNWSNNCLFLEMCTEKNGRDNNNDLEINENLFNESRCPLASPRLSQDSDPVYFGEWPR